MTRREATNLIDELADALAGVLPRNVCLTNRNVHDDATVPLECTMGDLRRIRSAIAKARGEQVSA